MAETSLQDNRKVGWFWAYNKVLDDFAGKIDVYAFAVYMALCRHAMNRGKVRCSLRFIASTLSISVSTASGAIIALEAVGLIEVEKTSDGLARTYILLDMIDSASCSLSEQGRSSSEQKRSRGSTPLFALRTDNTNNEVKTNTKDNITVEMLEKVYELYPRKVAKRAALKAIEKAVHRLLAGEYVGMRKNPSTDDVSCYLQTRVAVFARSREGQDETFTPFPATWFNGSRYLDSIVGVSSETSEVSDAGEAVVSAVDKVRRQLGRWEA